MRKAQWAKSGSGPDVMDVSTAMAAIQSLHGVSLNLVMSPDGEYGEGGVWVTCVATQIHRLDMVANSSVSRKRHYPDGESETFEGLLLRLVYEIDLDCSTFWEQGSLPGA